MAVQPGFVFSLGLIYFTLSACYAIYLENYCNKVYTVNQEVKINLMRRLTSSDDINCKMTLIPSNPDTSRLKANFLSYDYGETYLFTDRCQAQAILLNNYFGTVGYCTSSTPGGYYDLGKKGTFGFVLHRPSTAVLSTTVTRAELLVTEVRDKNGGDCPSDYFDCENDDVCIDDSLKCNDNNNCGNRRDEIEGCGLSTGIIVGIVFGVIGFIVIVIVVVLLIIRFK